MRTVIAIALLKKRSPGHRRPGPISTLGHMSKSPTSTLVQPPQVATAALLVAVRSAAITNGMRGCLAFAICSTATSLSSTRTFDVGSVDSHTHWFDTLTARGGYLVATERLALRAGWRGVGGKEARLFR